MITIYLLSSPASRGQSNSVADRSSEVIGKPENTSPERPDADYQPSAPGSISLVDAEMLQYANTNAATALSQAPDDPTGKQSTWYSPLQTWIAAAGQAATTKTHNAVFTLIPTMANYFARDAEAEPLASQLTSIRNQMESCGSVVLRAIGSYIEQNNGTVDGSKLNSFVRVYATGHFFQEGEWEGEIPPINAAGVMILDAAAVVTQLKAGPWQQAKQFLGGATTANGFFSRYTGTGDGLAVLKTKYAANQSVIDAKFSELKTWADQQEQQAGGGN